MKNCLKHLFFICFFILINKQVIAQVVTIKQHGSGLPVLGASVFCIHSQVGFSSNKLGKVDLQTITACDTIRISAIGFETQNVTFETLRKLKFTVHLTEAQMILQSATVSYQRFSKSFDLIAKQNPQKTLQTNAKTIEMNNGQTAADLLERTGQVFMQKSQQGGGSPVIRGFAANRLLIAVDGVRMNNAIFRSGNIQQVISLDPFNIESSEVLFGPGSVLYGSDAIGGVMRFRTKSPSFTLQETPTVTAHVANRLSSANQESTQHLSLQVGLKNWAFLSAVSYNNFGDLRMGTYRLPASYKRNFIVQRISNNDSIISNPNPYIQSPSGYNQLNLMQKIKIKIGKSWLAEYAFHHTATSEYARYDRHIRYNSSGVQRDAEWSYGPQKWTMHQLTLKQQANYKLYDYAVFNTALQFFEESRISRRMQQPERVTRTENVMALSLNTDFYKKIRKNQTLSYGLEFVYNNVQSVGTEFNLTTQATQIAAARYPLSDWSSAAAYVSYEIELSKKWMLFVGSRYNYFELNADFSNNSNFYPLPFYQTSINRNGLTANTGLVYNPSSKTAIHSNLSSGFRAPNIDDIGKFFDIGPGLVVVPNANLNAEYAVNMDIGLTQKIHHNVKLDLSVYATRLLHAIVRRDYVLNGEDSLMYDGVLSKVQALQNAANAFVVGGHASIIIKINNKMAWFNTFNYQYSKEEMDNGTVSFGRHTAPAFGQSKISYANKKWQADLVFRFSAAMPFYRLNVEERDKPEIYALDINGNPFSPAWNNLDLRLKYTLNKYFLVHIGIENMFNYGYRPYSSGIVAPGRNFTLTLKGNIGS